MDDTGTSHLCSLRFGSWTYDMSKLDIRLGYDNIDFVEFVKHPVWSVLHSSAERNVKHYECCPESWNSDITYNITFRRTAAPSKSDVDKSTQTGGGVPASHAGPSHIFIPPAVLTAFWIPFLFLLPPDSKQRLTVCKCSI
jgi:hypothetical protein